MFLLLFENLLKQLLLLLSALAEIDYVVKLKLISAHLIIITENVSHIIEP